MDVEMLKMSKICSLYYNVEAKFRDEKGYNQYYELTNEDLREVLIRTRKIMDEINERRRLELQGNPAVILSK